MPVDLTRQIRTRGAMQSHLRIFVWILFGGLVALTVVPASVRPINGFPHNLEHFLAFGLVATLFALGYPNHPIGLALFGAVSMLIIELVQIPLPTRHARLEDFFFDTLAIWIGISLTQFSQKLLNSRVA
jgi:glycopeptide antibiotics resistance protein